MTSQLGKLRGTRKGKGPAGIRASQPAGRAWSRQSGKAGVLRIPARGIWRPRSLPGLQPEELSAQASGPARWGTP